RVASAEAESAFGDGSMYLEKAIVEPRHVEMQVLADGEGGVVVLGERDCSVQRRHQKLIEESPSPAVNSDLRQQMIGIVSKAMSKMGYESVGTLEFLMDETGKLYFLEMNTRFQVEHPVTEMITGLDIVKTQIEIAAGSKLPITQKEVKFQGHAIECRINAEDPIKFRPSTGVIRGFHVPGGF